MGGKLQGKQNTTHLAKHPYIGSSTHISLNTLFTFFFTDNPHFISILRSKKLTLETFKSVFKFANKYLESKNLLDEKKIRSCRLYNISTSAELALIK